jgi:hypothetical protein
MRQRARACGAAVRREDGARSAVQVVERYFGLPTADR